MSKVTICEPTLENEEALLIAIKRSFNLHHPWINPPTNHQEFLDYFKRNQESNQQSF